MNPRRNAIIVSSVIAIACLIVICVGVAWSMNDSQPTTADEYVQKYGGNQSTYSQILSMTDCSALQNEFEVANSNNQRAAKSTPEYQWTLGYMRAADNRMIEIGCYDTTQ